MVVVTATIKIIGEQGTVEGVIATIKERCAEKEGRLLHLDRTID